MSEKKCRTVEEKECDDPEYGSKEEWVEVRRSDVVTKNVSQVLGNHGGGVCSQGRGEV